MSDVDILLEWRNDAMTRKASRQTHVIGREEHEKWLKGSLINPNRTIYIAEERGVPVGTMRADFEGGAYTLSWTVSPKAQGRGIGKRMVALLTATISAPLKAEVKVENRASARIAEHAGLTLESEKDGVLYYARGPLSPKK